ncbi:MAG TPA: hypothetical protein EYP53_03705 [Candidatus Latescibacteria bacterium]|nr:hypothetical protein [Candidatus Latescibacterota bacterium]
MDIVLQNGIVLVDDELKEGMDVQIAAGRILRIVPGVRGTPSAQKVIDVSNRYVLPGFIDLHAHGIGDVLAEGGDMVRFAEIEASFGVTACLPTFFSSPERTITNLKRALGKTDGLKKCPSVLGFRLEAPYISKTGAGHPEHLAPISPETTRALYEASQGKIRIWDVSPEKENAIEFIKFATGKGIVTSLAHTSATVEEVKRAIEAGLSLVTHLYDTFDPPIETDPGVYPAGLTDYIQIEDRLTVEIVADGVHVHPHLLEKTLRCKGLDRVIFITDSQLGAGYPTGIHTLPSGERVEITPDRGARRLSNGELFGSAITQLQSFRNAINLFGRAIPEASRLCSRNPAKVLGLSGKGYLGEGMDADIVVLDKELNVRYTLIGGRIVYREKGGG